MMWTLKNIAELLKQPISQTSDREVVQLSVDSRTIKQGMVFVALKGDKYDGHLFVEEVLEKKAAAAIVEHSWYEKSGQNKEGILFPVKNPLRVLQKIAKEYRTQFHIPVIGITGTNGKTTTKEMLSAVLSTQFTVAKTIGNFNNHIGLPLTICSWSGPEDIGVLEMGINHFGELTQLCDIAKPSLGLITNIGKGHLEFLKDLDGVTKAKCELLDYLPSEGYAFINGDDPHLVPCKSIVRNTVTFGFSDSCDIQGKMDRSNCEKGPCLHVNGMDIHLNIEGMYHASNALAAVAVSCHFGVDKKNIQEALERYQPVKKRMEKISVSGITIFDDTYNANPSSMILALEAFESFEPAVNKYIVLGDMLELGDAGVMEHQEIGRKLRKMNIQGFFAYGPLMEFAVVEVDKGKMTHCEHFESKDELIEILLSKLQKGDAVLVKGSRGMQMDNVVVLLKKALEYASWG